MKVKKPTERWRIKTEEDRRWLRQQELGEHRLEIPLSFYLLCVYACTRIYPAYMHAVGGISEFTISKGNFPQSIIPQECLYVF